MPRPKYDADALGREYATMRAAAGGVLTHGDFFKAKRIPRRYGSHKFGRTLDAYWERTRAEAESAVSRRNGVNLARELADLFKKHKALAARGFEKIIPDGGGAGLQPDDLEEALALFDRGSVGIRDIMKILSGGQPVQPPERVEPVFKWNEPIEPNGKKRKARRNGR